MRKIIYLLLTAFSSFLIGTPLQAQNPSPPASSTPASPSLASIMPTPEDKWEVGLSLGHSMINGDIDFKPGFGAGLHVRRALDYIFSIRGDLGFMTYNGEATSDRGDRVEDYNASAIGGALHAVFTLNNLRWTQGDRNNNVYVFGGGGAANVTPEATINGVTKNPFGDRSSTTTFADAGGGIAFKISQGFNIAIEHKVTVPFGSQADLIDGVNNVGANQTTYRDILHYTNVRLNFNIGAAEKVEPLYWINPLDLVLRDIAELKARPVFDLSDTDKDGVIDMIDQEKNSEADAIVNSKGVTLDSDGDGLPDHKDKEPFSPIGYSYDADGVAQIPEPDLITKTEVQEMIDESIKDFKDAPDANTLVDWFLPMVHFDADKAAVRRSEYGTLAGVASVLKRNTAVRLVVTGYTDKTASDTYNNLLSYNRAKAVIDYLVTNHSIDRSRLVLNWQGESGNIEPTQGNSFMNRRVEFRVATDETDMAKPE